MKTATVGIYETAGYSAADQFSILVNANALDAKVLMIGISKEHAEDAITKVHITHKDWFLDKGITKLKVDGRWMYELKEIKEFCPVEDT
jgi:hypothetical protein